MQSYLLSEIIAHFGGSLVGKDCKVCRVNTLQKANKEDIAFLANAKYRPQLANTQAAAVIVKDADMLPENLSAIVCDDPYLYFAKVARLFNPPATAQGGIHPTAVIDPTAIIPKSCEIGAHVLIGAHVRMGEKCRILSGSVIEEHCILGDDCVLHARVTLYPHSILGQQVIIHSGSVIGADGFGLAWDKTENQWFKIVQSGGVRIGDNVEIGANTTIDCGALGDTTIGNGVKIDNLVQIAHNVTIGEHTAIAACVGISGSTHIGAYCIIGGAAMFVGHIDIADKTMIGGGTLVSHSIKEAGHYASSYPLQTHRDWVKNAVHLRQLNQIHKRIKILEQDKNMPISKQGADDESSTTH